jgi:hypothetical protein
MHKIIGLYSYRNIQSDTFFWQIVFEWEDIFQQKGIQLCNRPQFVKNYKYPILNNINNFLCNVYAHCFSQYYFYFAMETLNYSDRLNNRIVIQNIIDFYLKKAELPKFYKEHQKNPFLLIASKEALEFLRKNKCPIKCHHFPLSISDIYRIDENSVFTKKYDLVMVGRQNPVLSKYCTQYASTHPEFHYVYGVKEQEDIESVYYTSLGECLGQLNRTEYIELLKKSKVSLYSTPGIDNGRPGANGFNQVTPRFFELIACGCHIIARYVKNADTDYFRLTDICPHTDTYEKFEIQMNFALTHSINMKKYADYLNNHYTSVRVNQLNEILATQKSSTR